MIKDLWRVLTGRLSWAKMKGMFDDNCMLVIEIQALKKAYVELQNTILATDRGYGGQKQASDRIGDSIIEELKKQIRTGK